MFTGSEDPNQQTIVDKLFQVSVRAEVAKAQVDAKEEERKNTRALNDANNASVRTIVTQQGADLKK
eukprot:1853256-Prymnesium_polylepis.1